MHTPFTLIKKPFINTLNGFYYFSTFLLIITILLYGNYWFEKSFLSSTINGDESKFYEDLIRANSHGLFEAINSGASITFLTFNYWVDKLVNSPLRSIRLSSLFFGVSILVVCLYLVLTYFKFPKITKIQVFLSLIYFFTIQTTLFAGLNDLLLHFFGLIFLYVFIRKAEDQKIKFIVLGILCAAILATRKMGAIYLLVFIILFWTEGIINKSNHSEKLKVFSLLIPSFMITFLCFNFSSLLSGNGFSFDDKILKSSVNWAQWEFHNALLIDQGLQERFYHVEISETEKYLEINGDNSLPSNFFEMIFFNPLFTLKEFFIDFFTSLKYFVRQLGLWVFIYLYYLLKKINNIMAIKKFTRVDFLYFFSLFSFLVICFIVITNIQMRWFTYFIPIMLLVLGEEIGKKNITQQKIFFTLNNFGFSLMCFPLIVKNYL